jgi:AraC-like DNA-binding protein
LNVYKKRAAALFLSATAPYTDKSLSAIALYLGFSSQGHFAKVFRELTGMTPGEYRDKKRG